MRLRQVQLFDAVCPANRSASCWLVMLHCSKNAERVLSNATRYDSCGNVILAHTKQIYGPVGHVLKMLGHRSLIFGSSNDEGFPIHLRMPQVKDVYPDPSYLPENIQVIRMVCPVARLASIIQISNTLLQICLYECGIRGERKGYEVV